MKSLFTRFVREEQGQDLIEYALLAGLISIASIVAITNLGTAIQGKFTDAGAAVTADGSSWTWLASVCRSATSVSVRTSGQGTGAGVVYAGSQSADKEALCDSNAGSDVSRRGRPGSH